MASVGIFYGSTTGNTENAAKLIQAELGGIVETIKDIKKSSAEDFEDCDAYVLGISTWDDGQLQEDWAEFWDTLDEIDFSGKTVAIFGCGDQEGYGEYFVSAMGKLYNKVKERGAKVVGEWPTEGYTFSESEAVVGGKFVGLPIDEDNQSELTGERVTAWCAQIKGSF